MDRTSGVTVDTSDALSTRETALMACDVCNKQTSNRCQRCGAFAYCDRNCFVKYFKEHRRVCKVLSEPQKLAHEGTIAEMNGVKPFWIGLDEPSRVAVVEYMDVVSLCRTDSAMTGVEERKEWQKALKGLHSVAMNRWPKHVEIL